MLPTMIRTESGARRRPAHLPLYLGFALPIVVCGGVFGVLGEAEAQRGAPAGGPRDFTPEVGVIGTVYPQPSRVLLEATVVHQDTEGGTDQVLLALEAGPAGFGAIWQDARHGNIGLMLGLLDPSGERLSRELEINQPRTSRQMDPTLAMGPGRHVAVAWFGQDAGLAQARLRDLTLPRVALGAERLLGSGSGRDVGLPRQGPGAEPSRRPAVVLRDPGGFALWRQGGRVLGQELGPHPAGRSPVGEPQTIDPRPGPAAGALLAAGTLDGGVLAAWESEGGVVLWHRSGSGEAGRPVDAGTGVPLSLTVDPRGAGWLLVQREGEIALQAIGRDGAPRGEARVLRRGQPVVEADLAGFASGLALAWRAPDGEAQLELLGWNLEPLAPPLEVFGSDVVDPSGLRIAAEGQRLILAWTDRRRGSGDVRFRVLEFADERWREVRGDSRWATDEASSDQTWGRVASDGSRRAVAVWEDRRSGGGELYARRIELADGAVDFAGEEFRVGDTRAPGVARMPEVAMAADGSFALVWMQSHDREHRILARTYDPASRPMGATLDLCTVRGHAANWPVGLKALPGGGYAVLWGADDGARLARIGPRGTLMGRVQLIEAEPQGTVRHPHLSALADGRLLALWDETARGRPGRLAGRFLSADLRPLGRKLEFPPSPNGTGDIDPVAAPAPDGGFLLAWTGNDSPTRSVFARRFDREGRPVGPMLPISVAINEQDYAELVVHPEGGWIAVWEDDISFRDHIHARRVGLDGSLGRRVTVNPRETVYVPDRTYPSVALLEGALICLYGDRSRGQGLDVFVRVLGLDFDRDLPPEVVIDHDGRVVGEPGEDAGPAERRRGQR